MDIEKMKEELKVIEELKNVDQIQDSLFKLQQKLKNISLLKQISAIESYQVWTDGACSKNPGVGGWAALIRIQEDKEKKEFFISGGKKRTTNNIMELTAAIEALKTIPIRAKVQVFTDSQYLKRGMREWLQVWKKRNWKKSNGKSILNLALWKELDQQNSQKKISWHWVKGHNKITENETCDQLARVEITKIKATNSASL